MKNFFSTVILFLAAAVSQNAFATVQPTVSLSPSTTTINHPIAVTLSVINPGSSSVTVTDVKLTATSTSNPGSARLPLAFSKWNSGPNAPVVTLAGSNAATSFGAGNVIFFSPSTGITGSGSGTYTIGGTVYTSDGVASPVTIGAAATINPIPLPAYERQ